MTPMMRQYLELKKQYPDSILFFRLGDFYEMFFDDAKLASRELDLTLTGRDCGQDERAPMCGVPYHSCESYISRLIAKGYKVAICEQVEDPALAKGLVKREVVRVITPGTVIEGSMLDESRNNYLCSIAVKGDRAGVCFVDFSTGEVSLTHLLGKNLSLRINNELGRFYPSEVLLNGEAAKEKEVVDFISNRLGRRAEVLSDENFDLAASLKLLKGHFEEEKLKAVEPQEHPESVMALGAALLYLYETQKTGLERLATINFYTNEQYMRLDISTRRNLELVETMRTKDKKGSLLWVLDKTRTAMGKRLIRNWIEQPLMNPVLITKRLNAVGELVEEDALRNDLIKVLSDVFDLERLMTRIVYGTANARELRALAFTIEKIPVIKEKLSRGKSALLSEIELNLDDLRDVFELIDGAICEDPPMTVREGGIIREGYSPEVDELRKIMKDVRGVIAKVEADERERTGIKNLKVGYNRVFGYYIEVTKSNLAAVPREYIRKQTLVNCERYITEELKELEGRILGARERSFELEYALFNEIRVKVAGQLHRIQRAAGALAQLDVLCSFAHVARANFYCCPKVDTGGKIEIKAGRHPVVELLLDGAPFVPNDALLDLNENRVAIITGPNMAGKSTYMRQVALITLMAQIGSFVPAQSATIGVVDSIFTRVGASDDLGAGQSTFMVEMNEVAHILKNATKKSLLILDEIGRGTSTYDGMSIARAVLEYVADKKKLGAKALFATHYHELTELEREIEGIKNYNVAVKKRGDDIIFLRRIVPGGADESYGIEVAKLAGVPAGVVERAKEILAIIEADGLPKGRERLEPFEGEPFDDQISLDFQRNERIIERLKMIDINTLTPIEALNILFEICREANKG